MFDKWVQEDSFARMRQVCSSSRGTEMITLWDAHTHLTSLGSMVLILGPWTPSTHTHTHSPFFRRPIAFFGTLARLYLLTTRVLWSTQKLLYEFKGHSIWNTASISCLIALNELLRRTLMGKSYQCHQRVGTVEAKPPWRPAEWEMRIGRRTRCRSIAYIAPELSTVLKILRPLASLLSSFHSFFVSFLFLFFAVSFRICWIRSLLGTRYAADIKRVNYAHSSLCYVYK